MTKGVWIAALVLSVVVGITAVALGWNRPETRMVAPFPVEGPHLVISGEAADVEGLPKVTDGEYLLPLEAVRRWIDSSIYWDKDLKKVSVTTQNRVIRMKTGELQAYVNDKAVNLKLPVEQSGDQIYVPMQFLQEFYQIQMEWHEDSEVLTVEKLGEPERWAVLPEKAVIRQGASLRERIIRKISGETPEAQRKVRLYEAHNGWTRIRTAEGYPGFVASSALATPEESRKAEPSPAPAVPAPKNVTPGKLTMAWEMIYEGKVNTAKIPDMPGLSVLSPTWFQVANDKGTLINRSDKKYVDWAHSKGYQVWALVSNDFGDPSMTHRFLVNTDARDTLIRQMLSFVVLLGLDGINIDFENVNKADKDHLSQFVRELSGRMHAQGIQVSMDVGVPDGSDNWSLCYDRKAIGKAVDFVCVMGYDQNWNGGPKAGSIGELPWVEKAVKRTLQEVPAEKLVLAVPFYTRLWKETEKDGKTTATGTVYTMEGAKKLIAEKKLSPVWNPDIGQYVSTYFDEKDGRRSIWFEDTNSLRQRAALAARYKLAGLAGWRRGDEVPEAWKAMVDTLNAGVAPATPAAPFK